MHRVRHSLPYFRQLGWEPVIITVQEEYTDSYSRDELLLHTIPPDIEIYHVKALRSSLTRKLGLGSLAIRSFFHIRKKGNELLRRRQFDLVYFSTTAFHVMALGPYWKKTFGVPFIVDIQDPWRNDFYLDKPASERPPKFFVAYNIDKYLEAKTIPFADGIISVSKGYCDTFVSRYPGVKSTLSKVITFGISDKDVEVMKKYNTVSSRFQPDSNFTNIIYAGRGGHDMSFALNIIFGSFAKGLALNYELFSKIRFTFIGTSYALAGSGKKTIEPIAETYSIKKYVTEITDRIPYFETLSLLNQADILLVPGSTDSHYTASKIYPYIILKKKLLAVFNENSGVADLLKRLQYGELITFDHEKKMPADYLENCYTSMYKILSPGYKVSLNESLFEPYKALAKAKEQTDFFDTVVAAYKIK